MSDPTDGTEDNGPDPGTDLGDPVNELRALRDPVPQSLLDRVHGSIRRRELAADVTRFSLWTPFLVLLEYVSVLLSALGASPPSPSEPPQGNPPPPSAPPREE